MRACPLTCDLWPCRVKLATDTKTGDKVALKLIDAKSLERRPKERANLEREVRWARGSSSTRRWAIPPLAPRFLTTRGTRFHFPIDLELMAFKSVVLITSREILCGKRHERR